LDPSKNYLFGYHPHGIISVGAFVNFGTEATHFSKLFGGINLNLMTLGMNFNIPIAREIILSLGIVSASKASCEYILNSGPGNSLMVTFYNKIACCRRRC
jgi:2-acylglycerol O-acyltransferase 2